MDNPESTRLCPRCFLVEAGERCRGCAGRTEAFGGAAGVPMVVGRLRLLRGVPSLADLVAGWSGPRRFPRPPWGLEEPAAVCRHHQGNMIWLWEAHWPDAFADGNGARTLRALLHSKALMLELPVPDSPVFRAAFARSGCRTAPAERVALGPLDAADAPARPTLPAASDLLADLDQALDAVGATPARISLVHPDSGAAPVLQVRAQWSRFGCQIHCETDARGALAWCIGELPTPARRREGGTGARASGAIEIGILDLGGWLGRGLVAGLHELKPGSYDGLRLLDTVEEASAALRQLRRESLKHLPPPLLPAPPWRGLVRHGWGRQTQVQLALIEEPAEAPPATLVVLAVGDNRLRGEQLLAELLDHDYPRRVPLLLLQDTRSDRQLLDWARLELRAPILEIGSEPATATAMRLIAHCL